MTLQTRFEQWGLPDAIRFDNGRPWGSPNNRVPTALALWLVGLGIQLHFGRPRQSTDNAVVERCHGVLLNWVEPETCAHYTELEARLAAFAHIQRAVYPSCEGGQSRAAHFPDLFLPRRPYHRDQEAHDWQLQRVRDYVAQFRFTRRVEKNGRITHFTEEYSVGRDYAAQQVTVFLDATTGYWIVQDTYGQDIKQFDATQLDYDTLANLRLRYRKG